MTGKRGRCEEMDDVKILIIARAQCQYNSIGAHICARTLAHAKRISMPQTVGQLLVLRRRASENHKLGRSEVTGAVQGLCAGRWGLGRRRPRSACRMHLHLKWLRLPDTPLRNHVMRDFYCFLPILSFLFGSTASRYHARQHQILGFHWDPGFLPDFADRGFRLLSVANIP